VAQSLAFDLRAPARTRGDSGQSQRGRRLDLSPGGPTGGVVTPTVTPAAAVARVNTSSRLSFCARSCRLAAEMAVRSASRYAPVMPDDSDAKGPRSRFRRSGPFGQLSG